MLAQPRRFGHLLFAGRFGLGVVLCLSAVPAKSDSFTSPWSGQATDKAQMRLIAATHEKGVYEAAAEIKLAPQAITYWREPGDAGVPPKFSIEGSENVANAEILYPAPSRMEEQGIEAFGYRGDVVFPIHIEPRDAARPVRLQLSVDYAVCDNICLPVKSQAELVLPQAGDSQESATIAAAEARVPLPLSPSDVAEKVSITADKTATGPAWLLAWKGDVLAVDLFVEAPEGWAIETHRRADRRFSLVAVQQPLLGAGRRLPVRLTLTGPRSYEFVTELDVPANPQPRPSTLVSPQGQASGTK
jgi:DsbC/DsbD-like thiol-disulfide interchange protein